MLIIKTKQRNSLVVTVSQNSTIPNPEWLFSFTHIFSKQQVRFIPTDISFSRSRYDEFEFIEGTGVGEIAFPYEGQYNYKICQQPKGSGNLDPALSDGAVEYGTAIVLVSSADTTNEYYVEFISDNEFNSNYIFAPNELNPPPPPSPTPTQTSTSTPTPTGTPTQTPTNTETPTQTPTQTNTPTPSITASATPTGTPTQTPTNTGTPTQTPTSTPNAVCPEEFTVTNSSSVLFDDGIYTRQYLASGQTFQFGYAIQNSSASGTIILGTAPDGKNYPIFQYPNGGDINTVYYMAQGGLPLGWRSMEQAPNILSSGSTWVGGSTNLFLTSNSIEFDGVFYPESGQNLRGYITYPVVCPTPTPTGTPTQTPTPSITASATQTPTPSITATNTGTPTQTPTNTQTPTTTQTPTNTETPTQTPTNTGTPTPTPTPTNTETPTQTPTTTQTPTNTETPTQTPTNTQTSTGTPTPTPSTTPFNPSSLSPEIWVDFSDSSTMTFRTGTSFLEKITNKGVYGGLTAFTQSTASNQPEVVVSTQFPSGLSAVTTGDNWITSNISTSAMSNSTRVIVIGNNDNSAYWDFRWGSGSAYDTYGGQTSTSVRKAFFLPPSTFCRIDCNLTNRPTTGQTYLEYVSTSASTRISYSSFNGSGATETTASGSNCSSTGFNDTPPISSLSIVNQANPDTSHTAEVGEILIFARELTTTETDNLLSYLKTKWGLQY